MTLCRRIGFEAELNDHFNITSQVEQGEFHVLVLVVHWYGVDDLALFPFFCPHHW
jgi:hypothetical protein